MKINDIVDAIVTSQKVWVVAEMGEEEGKPRPTRGWGTPWLSHNGFMSCRLYKSVSDQLSQLWNELSSFHSVLEVLPKRNPELAACFL